jgi:threonine/homoserine efflux transporter RhtA
VRRFVAVVAVVLALLGLLFLVLGWREGGSADEGVGIGSFFVVVAALLTAPVSVARRHPEQDARTRWRRGIAAGVAVLAVFYAWLGAVLASFDDGSPDFVALAVALALGGLAGLIFPWRKGAAA